MVSLQGRSQSCAIKKLKFKEKKNRRVKKFFFISKDSLRSFSEHDKTNRGAKPYLIFPFDVFFKQGAANQNLMLNIKINELFSPNIFTIILINPIMTMNKLYYQNLEIKHFLTIPLYSICCMNLFKVHR